RDADKELKEIGFSPATIKLRHKHKLLIKAVDFHHIESKERILIIDTDVFPVGGMRELWDKITEGAALIFNNDPEPAYGSSRELLEKVLGRKLEINFEPCVNTGLIVEPAAMLRKAKAVIDGYCREFENFTYPRIHCIEQGYIACFLKAEKIGEHPLSDRYRLIGNNDRFASLRLTKYNFENNPDNLETIHLCGWDKLGKDFRMIKKRLKNLIYEEIKRNI
ncbi:MAG: hypothetical protein WBC74_03830, partial [Candidatus Omnitrophota bacterium]